KIGFKSASTLCVASHICWSVVIKRWNQAKLPFAPAVVKTWGSMDVNEVIEKLQQEIRSRSLKQLEE
ncbi:hypothetical protein SU67_24935, partial [Escherichia coli O139:H28 str. E24377A]